MTFSFCAGHGRRGLLLALLGATSLLTTACLKGEDYTPQDYSAIDAGLIKQYVAANTLANAQPQASGLYYVPVVTNASARQAQPGDSVFVRYTGSLLNGTVFDATSQHNNVAFKFVLGRGQVIAGWDQGIALMHLGDQATLLIPSALGYGARGAGAAIPPNSVLRFDVQLVNVK